MITIYSSQVYQMDRIHYVKRLSWDSQLHEINLNKDYSHYFTNLVRARDSQRIFFFPLCKDCSWNGWRQKDRFSRFFFVVVVGLVFVQLMCPSSAAADEERSVNSVYFSENTSKEDWSYCKWGSFFQAFKIFWVPLFKQLRIFFSYCCCILSHYSLLCSLNTKNAIFCD